MQKPDKNHYIKMPAGFLFHPDLRLTEKVFLSIVYSLSKRGLQFTNNTLGRLLGLNETNTSRMIAKLDREGWTRTTGKGTRWRKIYLADNSKVKDALPCRWEHFTLPLATNYLAEESKPNKRNKRNNKKTSFSPSLAEPKTHPDPAKVDRVLTALGFEGGGL